MKLRLVLMTAMAVLMTFPSAYAQDGDGDRPRRKRDRDGQPAERGDRPDGRGPGFGRGFGPMFGGLGAMGPSGAIQLLGLLRMEEVRREVGLTDDAFAAIEEQQAGSFERFRELRNASEEDRIKIFEELNSDAQELLDEALPPEKQKRLLGLFVQQARGAALMNPQVAQELSLSEETTKAIQDELRSFGDKMRELFQAARNGEGPPDFAAVELAREELDKSIQSKLTDEQKQALEALKGEKFEFPEFGPGFGRGPRGGPDGPGPREERRERRDRQF